MIGRAFEWAQQVLMHSFEDATACDLWFNFFRAPFHVGHLILFNQGAKQLEKKCSERYEWKQVTVWIWKHQVNISFHVSVWNHWRPIPGRQWTLAPACPKVLTEKLPAPGRKLGSARIKHENTPKLMLIWTYLYLIWNSLFPFQNGHILFWCTPLSDARTPIFGHISNDLNLRGCTTQTAWKALVECWARCGCGAGDHPWCLHQTWDTSEKIGSSPQKKRV